MKRILLLAEAFVISFVGNAQKKMSNGYPITPVEFTKVSVTDSFWGQRLKASREKTIPLAFGKCEETKRYANFEKAAHPSESYKVGGFSFDDTDVYKTIEGASYSLQTAADQRLEEYIDSVLDIVARAQEPDGYLYTSRTMNPWHPHEWSGPERWSKEEDLSHELYNLGHMIEGAVAHYQATGSRKFLDIACRYADCVCREVGPAPGQALVVPGHQIAEMALCKLYVLTGESRYLEEAKFLLDYRGKTTIRNEYSQSHKPVIEQDEAVGHAVRAAYMYAGMADVAALTGDKSYIDAVDRIWENIVNRKMYVTGGIGSTASGEAFGRNYELPNMSAYCETCAAIGNVYVNYRLFLLHGESKYYDVLERTLYNGLISGVSLDGGAFFYPNPLESMGQHQRQSWFGCACCPSNIARFIPSLPGYVYAVNQRNVYVNLFMSNHANLCVEGKDVALEQTTDYPWDGDIVIKVSGNKAGMWAMKLRVPGWARNQVTPGNLYEYSDNQRPHYSVKVNGELLAQELTADGYLTIERKWKKGDEVLLHLDMYPRTVRTNAKVEADRGLVAIERGPLVYCAEWPDNNYDIMGTLLNQTPEMRVNADTLHATHDQVADYYMKVIKTDAQVLSFDEKGKLVSKDVCMTLIPYYAWCHRGSGQMRVWLTQDLSASRPSLPPTLASQSKTEASSPSGSLRSVNDGLVPKDGDDRSLPYCHWWPKTNSTEWIVYEFPESSTVQSATVYWFDDTPWGGCQVPKAWRLFYKNVAGDWQPVRGTDAYPTQKGVACTVHFDPVCTSALKMEIDLPESHSSGVFEWIVK